MANVACFGPVIVCSSGNKISVFDIRDGKREIIRCPKPDIPEEDKHKKRPEGNEDGTDRILACGFSPKGSFFATCDDIKRLTLWCVTSLPWTKISTRQLVRRCTALTYTSSEDTLLVADKSGDVYAFSTADYEHPGTLLLGHVSMLLDLCLCDGDKLLMTCDRDEKIRVSCYPNSYSIHGFCLAHTQFVSRLCYLPEDDVVVSGSGDGTIRVWDHRECRLLYTVDCRKFLTTSTQRALPGDERSRSKGHEHEDEEGLRGQIRCLSVCSVHKLVAVAFDREPQCLVFRLDKSPDKSVGAGVHLTLVSSLTLEAVAWDLSFTSQAHLLVLQRDLSQPLLIFRYDTAANQMVSLGEADDTEEGRAVVSINKDSAFFSDSMEVESIFSSLHKAKIDNMTEYIEKKKQRIQGNKSKSEATSAGDTGLTNHASVDDSEEPTAKMLKVE